jgi:hypothetical protein
MNVPKETAKATEIIFFPTFVMKKVSFFVYCENFSLSLGLFT